MKVKSVFAAPFLMIVVLALFGVVSLLDADALAAGVSPYLSLVIVQLLVYALPSVFFCRLRGKEYTPRLRMRLFRPTQLFLLFFALLAILSGSALLNIGMLSLFPNAEFTSAAADYAGAAGTDFSGFLYAVLALCILPALLEEFLFRGIITAEYESVSVPCAVLMSSFLFAMMHLSFIRLPACFFSGVILSLTMYATRSVIAPMIVHAANNTIALWMDRYLYTAAGEVGERGVLLTFILVSVLLVSLILFSMLAQNAYTVYGVTNVPSPHVRTKKRGERVFAIEAIAAPPFLFLFVLFVIFTAVT